jgi:hypothetical protein
MNFLLLLSPSWIHTFSSPVCFQTPQCMFSLDVRGQVSTPAENIVFSVFWYTRFYIVENKIKNRGPMVASIHQV